MNPILRFETWNFFFFFLQGISWVSPLCTLWSSGVWACCPLPVPSHSLPGTLKKIWAHKYSFTATANIITYFQSSVSSTRQYGPLYRWVYLPDCFILSFFSLYSTSVYFANNIIPQRYSHLLARRNRERERGESAKTEERPSVSAFPGVSLLRSVTRCSSLKWLQSEYGSTSWQSIICDKYTQ